MIRRTPSARSRASVPATPSLRPSFIGCSPAATPIHRHPHGQRPPLNPRRCGEQRRIAENRRPRNAARRPARSARQPCPRPPSPAFPPRRPRLQRQPAPPRLFHQRARHHMDRYLIERGGDPQHLVRAPAGRRLDRRHRRGPVGERPRLSTTSVRTRPNISSAPPPFTSTPKRARARDAPPRSPRAREDQRTGRRHHQNRHGPDGIAREPPRHPRQRQGRRRERQREAIGETCDRRLRPCRLLHQTDDARVGAARRRLRRDHLEGCADVEAAAQHGAAGGDGDGQRLAP